ncbi:MAG: ATP-binding protein [Xenococcaceae cyanobacterium]
MWLHLIGDLAIALTFYFMPSLVIYLLPQPTSKILLRQPAFLWFIAACLSYGTLHLLEVWTIWQPIYWLTGSFKLITVIILAILADRILPYLPQVSSLLDFQNIVNLDRKLDLQITQLKEIDEFLGNLPYKLEAKVKERTSELNNLNQKLIREISARKNLETTLKYQLKLEQLISRLSTHFINLEAEKINEGIQAGLRTICQFSEVDRTYLFLFSHFDVSLDYTLQWSNLKSQSIIFAKNQTELEQNLPWIMSQIKCNQIVNLGKLDNLASEASIDKIYLQQQNIKSLLMLPMFYGGLLVGLLGFDSLSKERNWTEGDIQLLRLAGEIFINAIERCRQQQQLIVRTQELEKSNFELQQFTHIVSHDLQEPLRAISSYSQLLEEEYRDRLDSEANEYIDFIVGSAQRMKQLIQDLLAFSRVGRQPQNFSLVSCEAILQEVIANLKIAIAENEATITWDRLPEVMGDKSQLIQLWQNLIANSIKFRSQESPQIKISVTTQDREFIFCMEDNGIGIDPKHAERIFVIFQRLHSRRKYPGTGIGLAICKKIIERHKGRIWVESTPKAGSTFYFSLPIYSQYRS